VGLLPKPAIYRLFESLKREPEAKVTIFDPQEKENAMETAGHVLGLVEAGESRTLSETTLCFA